MPRALIALGANLGDRQQTLRRAMQRLTAQPGNTRAVASRFLETSPIGGPSNQGVFLNAAVALETSLAPDQLHALLQRIESELGREPAPRWAARAIDLDLLLYGDQVIGTEILAVPHPRMSFRRFVLAPAAEIASDMVHPLAGWTIGQLLAHLDASAPYVALLGLPTRGRAALAQRVARAVGGTYLAGPNAVATQASVDDPSGPGEERQIQFLDQARAVLAAGDPSPGRTIVVSDFYFDECLASARVELDERKYEQFQRAWAAARRQVVQPKLVVMLDTWEAAVSARGTAGHFPPDAIGADRLRLELLALATRADLGPVLFAGRDDPQAQFDEITAAIAAMG